MRGRRLNMRFQLNERLASTASTAAETNVSFSIHEFLTDLRSAIGISRPGLSISISSAGYKAARGLIRRFNSNSAGLNSEWFSKSVTVR